MREGLATGVQGGVSEIHGVGFTGIQNSLGEGKMLLAGRRRLDLLVPIPDQRGERRLILVQDLPGDLL